MDDNFKFPEIFVVPNAGDGYITAEMAERMARLPEFPFAYPVYRLDERFRLMVLPYQYLCFYRVDEAANTIAIHRLLRSMRDIPGQYAGYTGFIINMVFGVVVYIPPPFP